MSSWASDVYFHQAANSLIIHRSNEWYAVSLNTGMCTEISPLNKSATHFLPKISHLRRTANHSPLELLCYESDIPGYDSQYFLKVANGPRRDFDGTVKIVLLRLRGHVSNIYLEEWKVIRYQILDEIDITV